MFQILGIFSSIEVSIVSGVYSIVAKVYDIMLDLSNKCSNLPLDPLENMVQTCYVLAGVFMLFRTVIGLIQMLVNPDKMTDSNAGAGKLISRIVISIVLLLLLQPQGILFKGCENDETCNNGGLFPRIENALLADNGLINNLVNGDKKKLESADTTNSNMNIYNTPFIENVYADTNITCYYYRINEVERIGGSRDNKNKITINQIYKISFYDDINSQSGLKKVDGTTNIGYTIHNQEVDENYKNVKYNTLGYPISAGDHFKNTTFSGCPAALVWNSNTDRWEAKANMAPSTISPGIYGYGSTSLTGLIEQLKYVSNAYTVKTNNDFIKKNIVKESELDGKGYKNFLEGVRPKAVAFAQNAAKSFQECTASEKECSEAQDNMFETSEGNDKVEELIDADKFEIGFIVSMLMGIALVGYLLLLCVDVIIRKFKLTLLQVIAPIPAISYVDPNDKIFNQWMRMYIATYLDLFIKLLAIALACGLLEMLEEVFWDFNLLYKFFYIVAILVFIKIVPSMISKLFNLDSMGGSFKDILGMGKAAAGFGAGAVIGGVVGAATGRGLGHFTGLTKGAMMGAGSGAKGNITGGSQKIAAANKLENDGKDSGLNFFQRKMAGATAALGVQDAYSKAKAKKQVNDDFVSKASAYEDEGLNKVNKVIGNGFGNKFKNLVEARNDAQQASMTGKASLLREVDNGDGTTSFVNKLTGDNYATYNTSDVTDDMRSHFLDADNYSMSAAEAQARVKGAEKKASKQLRDDLAAGKYAQYGFKSDDADLAEMSSLKQAADSAAVRAGYKDGYTKDNKDAAKRISAEQGAIMDQNEAAHMYSERK